MKHHVQMTLTRAGGRETTGFNRVFDTDYSLLAVIVEFLTEFGMADCGAQMITIKIATLP